MRFAFMFINDGLDGIERTSVRDGDSVFVGVRDLGEACMEAIRLESEGIGCIELCGAFGEDGARAVMEATGMRVPVGYIVHLPERTASMRRRSGTGADRSKSLYTASPLSVTCSQMPARRSWSSRSR